MLVYTPTTRIRAFECCAHAFFDETRSQHANGEKNYPGHQLPLFTFLPEGAPCHLSPPLLTLTSEIALAQKMGILERIVPANEMGQVQMAAMSPGAAPSSPLAHETD